MKYVYKAISRPECEQYLKLIYKDRKYSLDEFFDKFESESLSIEKKIKKTRIIYRDKKIKYNEYDKDLNEFSDKLKFSNNYTNLIFPIEINIIQFDEDYYKAGKFIQKTEECLNSARFFLINSYSLLVSNFELNWNQGYIPLYKYRTMNFSTAVLWYNSCLDYILQTIYFGYGLYKQINGYESLKYEELLKKCDYRFFRQICDKNKNNKDLEKLKNMYIETSKELNKIRNWANHIKHRGGIYFKGLEAKDPLVIKIYENNECIRNNDEFNPIKIDMDECYSDLKNAHTALCKFLNSVVNFMNFKEMKIKQSDKDYFNKKAYKKILIKTNYKKINKQRIKH